MINIVPGLTDGIFTKIFRKLYIASSIKPLPKVELPSSLEKYWVDMCGALSQECKYDVVSLNLKKYNMGDSKKVMVAFSGGKDSVATAIDFKRRGYEVILYYVSGINRSYPNELSSAVTLSKRLDMELVIKKITVTGKCDYTENPTKNQFILAMMVDEGIKRGISEYNFGNIADDYINDINNDYMLSDGIEMFDNVVDFYRRYIPKFKLTTVLKNAIHPFIIISEYDKTLFNDIMSCIGPIRYKNNLRAGHKSKYDIELMEGRCGSCYKCAQEAYVLNKLEVWGYSEEYILHCIDIMLKWNKQLFNEGKETLDKNWLQDGIINEYLKNNKG